MCTILTAKASHRNRNILSLIIHTNVRRIPVIVGQRPVIIAIVLGNGTRGGRVVPIVIDRGKGGIAHASDHLVCLEGDAGKDSEPGYNIKYIERRNNR